MSCWIKVKSEDIARLSFNSVWYRFQVPYRIDALDYGNCKIKIRKIKPRQNEPI